jgi:phage gpG-like protein
MPSSASLDRDPLSVVVSIEHAAQVTDVDLQFVGDAAKSLIADRTRRGLDVDGAPFAPYSKAYAKTRTKSGRNASPVNLSWSGKMLQSITVVINRALNEVSLKPYAEEEARAAAHQFGVPGKLPQRRWFGVNEADAGRIAKLLERLVSKRVGALK